MLWTLSVPMKSKLRLSPPAFLLLSLAAACGTVKAENPTDAGGSADAENATAGRGPTGTAGSTGTGSSTGSDGSTAIGGSTGSGGSTGIGGSTGSGGSTRTGGSTGSGGSTRTGGSTGSGGSTAIGGSTGTGGSARTGGATGTAGSPSTGGSPGTGGSTDGGSPIDAMNSIDVNTMAPGVPVNLRTAATYVILAKSGISTVPPTAVTGNLGVSPIAATAVTGFSLIADSTNVFSTSTQVTGKVYAADYATPTPANLTTAVADMQLAFTDAAGRAPGVTELGAGNIGGMTLTPGVYKWGTGVLIPTNVTLNGGATGVWIFQIAQGLTMSSATNIFLTGGGLAKNVFWQVAGGVVIGTTAHLEGIVLTQTSVALGTGASIKGRLLAQTAVTMDTNTVVEPAP